MRTFSIFLSLLAVSILLSSAVNTHNADCDGYYSRKPGTKLELVEYNAKQQETGRTTYTVKSHSGGTTIFHVLTIDSKGKELVNTDYSLVCDGKMVTADQKKIVASTVAANITDPNVHTQVRGDNLSTPLELSAGQQLPDSEIDIDVKSSSISMTVKVKTKNRKVEGTETITVPAGTFECIVITAETETMALVPKKTKSKSWMAKGVGLVRLDTYDKKGKLEKTEVLTRVGS
jgi:hypothetical protein